MSKLYVIGNGFDLHHGLPTSYNDFHKYVQKNYPEIENDLEEFFCLDLDKNDLWSDFENGLGTFSWKSFFDEHNQIDLEDENFKPSEAFGLEDDLIQETDELIARIRFAFEDWIAQISLDSVTKKLEIDTKSKFLSFNYSLTLEMVYGVSNQNLLHIHGEIENNLGSLIFGHNQELEQEDELDENGDSNRTLFSDSENVVKRTYYSFQKPVNDTIEKNINFFESLSDIEEIIILGHSLNSIDIPYLKEIKKYVNDKCIWNVSFYKNEEVAEHQDALNKIDVKNEFINQFRM